ncbi:MAG: hypothetical protein R3C14_26455 [Caldilineaceae bacterium]
MAVSMRELFSRRGIDHDVISLRHALSNHPQGLKLGLREAHRRFLDPTSGNGFARGCRHPNSIQIGVPGIGGKDLGGVLPSWVPVAGNTRLVRVRDHRTGQTTLRLRRDYEGETRTVEGVLTQSKATHTDFPFKPWHTYYDWNFYVLVDKQYTYLNSESNLNDFRDHRGVIECEWDTAFLPDWAWPQRGDRIWMVGRWIYDCGHPADHGHKTEIHPPKAVASFRTEAVKFRQNGGPTRASNAILYIGRNGGYWRQPINNQDYVFDLHLPPKPYAEAKPIWKVTAKTGRLPVQPRINPFPADEPRLLRITVPLKGERPHPDEYGAIIAGGWSDPRGTESARIRRLRVTVEKIFMDANLDPLSGDEWYVYVGVNGRWKVWESIGGDTETLNYAITLDLHPDDRIHITACGREADEINGLMGKNIGLSWAKVMDTSAGGDNAGKIRDGFLSLGLSLNSSIENEAIGLFSQEHPSHALAATTAAAEGGKYRLRYRVDAL